MFVPLYDYNPLKSISAPYVNYALIIINVCVFVVFQSGLVLDIDQTSLANLGFIPLLLNSTAALPIPLPEPVTLLTYMFLHGGWLHLLGNMVFLWVFGDNVEDDMGHARYLAFYLLVGIAAAFAYALVAPDSSVPLIGASGAISGVVIAYAMLHPRVKLWVLVLMRIPLKIAAMWVVGAWVLFQFAGFLTASADDDTAWSVHIGGMLAGAILVLFLRRPGVRLFDPAPHPLPVPPTHTLTPE
jgi:membrane associated rhomboid family serine protease